LPVDPFKKKGTRETFLGTLLLQVKTRSTIRKTLKETGRVKGAGGKGGKENVAKYASLLLRRGGGRQFNVFDLM